MNHYQDFYDAAVAGDEKRIKELLATGACISEFQKNSSYKNAGYQLAKENNHKAVELLKKYGMPIHFIAQGYAVAGNHEKVEEYRRQGAFINYIVMGYAQGGHCAEVETYYQRYKTNYKFLPHFIARGYVLGNLHHDKVENIRIACPETVFVIAKTYAEIGNEDKATFYLTKAGLSDSLKEKYKDLVNAIAMGYAISNNGVKVQDCIQHHQACSAEIVLGYARGDNATQANLQGLALHGDTPACLLINGQAVGGHTSFNELNERAPIVRSLRVNGYTSGGHFNEIQKFYSEASLLSLTKKEVMADIAKGFAKLACTSYDDVLYFLVHIKIINLSFVQELNKTCQINLSEEKCKILEARAKKISQYMEQYGMDFEEAKAWCLHAQTLSPFIYNQTMSTLLAPQVFIYEFLPKITGLDRLRIDPFLEKVKKIGLHKPNSELIEGKSPTELLDQLIDRLESFTNKYLVHSSERFYQRAEKRNQSILLLRHQMGKLIETCAQDDLRLLVDAISLVKGHIQATLIDHQSESGMCLFRNFTTPDLVKAYRGALSFLPPQFVKPISAREINLDEEITVTAEDKEIVSSYSASSR